MSFICDSCSKEYKERRSLIRHIKSHFESHSQSFECYYCKRIFKIKPSLARHIRLYHTDQRREKPIKSKINRFKCGVCNEVFSSKFHINNHYLAIHKITLETQIVTLKSVEEFNEWKSKTQCQTFTQFVKQRSYKTKCYDVQTFVCHRSSYNRTDSRRKIEDKFPKTQGSKKLLTFCPAEMNVKISEVDGTCVVTYTNTHIGHNLNESEELPHIYLTKSERLHIAARLQDGISRTNVRYNKLSSKNVKSRSSILRPNDIKNIAASFVIDECTFNSDDINVDIFVKNNEGSVLYYKNQLMVDSRFGVLEKNDFVLILMNKTQEKYLRRYGENVVCFDGTHGTNKYHFLLHTLLILDVDRVGYPAAFIITNRNDKTAIDIFLQSIKDRVGDIRAKVLMSDMQPIYYNSWISVMDTRPKFYLNCRWYVNEAWKKKFTKKSAIWSEVKQRLYSLCSELNPSIFEEKLAKFLAIDNDEVKDFIDYFRDDYAQKAHVWAYCHRLHTGINTNMSLEIFHKQLKYQMAKSSNINWLSHTLRLMKNYLDRRESNCGTDSSKQTKLRQAHREARKYCDDTNLEKSFIIHDGDTFYIKSFSDEDVTYIITRTNGAKECTRYEDFTCSLRCQLCEVCFHEYECSCLENSIHSNMCKHIHVVGLYKQKHKTHTDTSTTPPVPVPIVVASQCESKKQLADENISIIDMDDNSEDDNDVTCGYIDDETCSDELFEQLRLKAHYELDRGLEAARYQGAKFINKTIKQYIRQIEVTADVNNLCKL